MYSIDVVVDHARADRPRAEQGVQRDQVLEAIGLELAQDVLHARRLELEHARGARRLEKGVGRGVVQGKRLEVDRGPLVLADARHAVVQQGQRLQPEEVHLQKADAADLVHGVLRDDLVVLRARQGRVLDDGARRDHDTGGVHRGVPRQSLQPPGHVQELPDALVLIAHLAQRRHLLDGLVDGHVRLGRDHLGDPIAVAVRDVQPAPGIANDGLRPHGREGDDLRHVVAPVLVAHVIDHLAAPPDAEIDVDVRHRDPLGVEETLEQEVVFQGIDVGDPQAVGGQRSGR